jgi:hypothetical protein
LTALFKQSTFCDSLLSSRAKPKEQNPKAKAQRHKKQIKKGIRTKQQAI